MSNEIQNSESSQSAFCRLSELRTIEVREFNHIVKEYELMYGDGDFIQIRVTRDDSNAPAITIGKYLDDEAGSEYFAKLGKT